jgi:hypothetical protein
MVATTTASERGHAGAVSMTRAGEPAPSPRREEYPAPVLAALRGYLVYSVSHLVFHATHLTGISPGGAAFLVTSLSVEPLLAAALLLLSWRAAPRRVSQPAGPPPGRDSRPADPGSRARSS